MTMKTVVTDIKPNKEGKVTDIRRNGALETHVGDAQGSYSLSSTATSSTVARIRVKFYLVQFIHELYRLTLYLWFIFMVMFGKH